MNDGKFEPKRQDQMIKRSKRRFKELQSKKVRKDKGSSLHETKKNHQNK